MENDRRDALRITFLLFRHVADQWHGAAHGAERCLCLGSDKCMGSEQAAFQSSRRAMEGSRSPPTAFCFEHESRPNLDHPAEIRQSVSSVAGGLFSDRIRRSVWSHEHPTLSRWSPNRSERGESNAIHPCQSGRRHLYLFCSGGLCKCTRQHVFAGKNHLQGVRPGGLSVAWPDGIHFRKAREIVASRSAGKRRWHEPGLLEQPHSQRRAATSSNWKFCPASATNQGQKRICSRRKR